ncbi:MAG: hypothetical protein ACKO5C_01425 [Ferruginibacter sp.]
MGDQYSQADLLILHASIGHDFNDMIQQAHEMAPHAQIVAA